ncbi:MAG: hypothetical protein ACYTA3_05970 [Planctomycetota bacterium]|jgi:hypothetical protein
MQRPTPLRTDRIRIVEPPFGWIPFRILTSGLLAPLSLQAKLLYFFLCLVADEQGMSYYGERRLKELLGLAEPARARDELQSQDLLAFDGKFYQLLSLPDTTRPGSVPGPETPPVESLPQRRSGPPQQLGELLTALGWRS